MMETESEMDTSTSSTSNGSQVSVSKAEYTADWEKCEVKIVKGKTSYVRYDFAIELLAMVEAGQYTGYLANVKRQLGHKSQICYFTADGIQNLNKFLFDINTSFGSGGMMVWYREKELAEFIYFLKEDQDLPVKQAVNIVGKQPNSNIWVLSLTLQVTSDGTIFTNEDAPYVWIHPDIAADSKFKSRLSLDLCPPMLIILTSHSMLLF